VKRGTIAKQFPARVKFLSLEPLLGEIWLNCKVENYGDLSARDWQWVIVGCESGAKKRVCEVKWVEHIVNSCNFPYDPSEVNGKGVPVFVKQLIMLKGGTQGCATKDGYVEKDVSKFPYNLRYQEYPKQFKVEIPANPPSKMADAQNAVQE
jgi:Protein of unknown function (DUF5131)